jgi:hypothetical protein
MFDHTGIVVTDLSPCPALLRRHRFKPLGLSKRRITAPKSFLFGRSAEDPIPYLWIGTTPPLLLGRGFARRPEPDACRLPGAPKPGCG